MKIVMEKFASMEIIPYICNNKKGGKALDPFSFLQRVATLNANDMQLVKLLFRGNNPARGENITQCEKNRHGRANATG